jgi:hypothetical protein
MSSSFTLNNANIVITQNSATITTRPDGSPLQINDAWIDTNTLEIKKWNGASWSSGGGGGSSLPCAVVRETKTANTNSAVTWTQGTTGNIQKRQFNVVDNSGMSVTVSGSPNWTFTIPTAGTYFFEARATIRTPTSDGQIVYGKLVLNNNTLGLGSVIVGDSHCLGTISTSILQNTNWTHHLSGFYTITGTTVFTLDHIIASQNFAPIGGLASNLLGKDEVYSVVNITKIA